jgi:hypothetical protein
MTTPDVPDIPLQLADRPTLGGLVVPWITARTPDGRYRFGSIDADRHARAFADRLCQTCGTGLGERLVFAMRDSDLRLMLSPEPGMHPVCVAYSAACPMLAGRMTHYRATALLPAQLAGLRDIEVHGDPADLRPGAAAERWHLAWVGEYRTITHPHTGQPAAMVLPEQILRIRLIATPPASAQEDPA